MLEAVLVLAAAVAEHPMRKDSVGSHLSVSVFTGAWPLMRPSTVALPHSVWDYRRGRLPVRFAGKTSRETSISPPQGAGAAEVRRLAPRSPSGRRAAGRGRRRRRGGRRSTGRTCRGPGARRAGGPPAWG